MDDSIYKTFKTGSTTYFYSSIFFPEDIREDVFVLYNFVRKADDFVDAVPQQPKAFYDYCRAYREALKNGGSGNGALDSFVKLIYRRSFDPGWIDAFLSAMEMDLTKKIYHTLAETREYMYGSAEVIGLMMANIMELEGDSHSYARMLGRSMQYINFIRDIEEDRGFGRIYLPLENTGLESMEYGHAAEQKKAFIDFIRKQIHRYDEWRKFAERGFAYIPYRYLIPIKTASDMYKWTARKIYQDPFIVYKKKVKPKLPRIIHRVLLNGIQAKRIGI